MVGWSFLFFVTPSLAVFLHAKGNSDVSKWNTGAVTTMYGSKCTRSPSLWPRLPLLWMLNIRQNSSFIGSHFSHVLFVLLLCFSNGTVFCGLWWVGLFYLCCTLLAVFYKASAFNQDVSKWNTGAVTIMHASKCTVSPSLWPRLPLLYILNVRQPEFQRITLLTRFIIFFCVFQRYSLSWFVVGWSFIFFVAHSFLQCLQQHLRSIRTCPNGIRGR